MGSLLRVFLSSLGAKSLSDNLNGFSSSILSKTDSVHLMSQLTFKL